MLKYSPLLVLLFAFVFGCNYVTYKTVVKDNPDSEDEPEPVYDVTLNDDYQDFVNYMYMGNRSEEFGTFFNKFYQSLDDFDNAMTDYRTTTISTYNRKLDSLNITPPISPTAKDLLNKVLAKCSKIIQYNNDTRFMDDAVLLIGKSYFYLGEYLSAERKFNEFLSKLTRSDLYDEAILYLGKTKMKLGKIQEAETIFTNLLKTTRSNEIKSEITQDLALLSLSKNDFQSAITNFKTSIELTKDKEKKAEKQYILAKIYSRYKPDEAAAEFKKSNDLTSDFDLIFYSRLNEAKSKTAMGKTRESLEMLDRMNSKYRDYPEMKQLVELEVANALYAEKKYHEAREKYFDIILLYPGTKSAADSYYHLGEYAEFVKNNYLYAYINYKKVSEASGFSDYANISGKKAGLFDKYFSLVAVINDTAKITYPENEPDFFKFREKWNKEKGVEEIQGKEPLKNDNNPIKPKGSGCKSGVVLDSLGGNDIGGPTEQKKEEEKKTHKDSLHVKNPIDTNLVKIEEQKKLSPYDSMIIAIHFQDSVRSAKQIVKIDAYFQLSELFLYELNRSDSALHYLELVVSDSTSSEKTSKALFTIATIYKNRNDESKANGFYKEVITRFPLTIYANESRRILGMEMVELAVDSASVLYKSAEKNILKNDYANAMSDLKKIIYNYPSTDSFYVRSLFSIGWLYENNLFNKDSSLSYYNKIKKDYPNSQFASTLAPKLEFYASLERDSLNAKLQDSLGLKKDSLHTPLVDSTGQLINPQGNLQNNIRKDSGNVNPGSEQNGILPPEDKKKEEKKEEKQEGIPDMQNQQKK